MRKFILGRFSLKHNSAAFTLIELLVVIAVLAALGVGTVSFINPQGQFDKARDVQIKNDLKQLQTALDGYYDDNQRYPPLNGSGPCGSGLSVLTSGSKKYIKVIPTPPGGGCYTYQLDTTRRWYVLLANHNHAISSETACPSSISSGCLATNFTPTTNYSCVYGGNIACPAAPNTPVPPTPTSGGGPIVPTPTVPPVDLPFGTGIDGQLSVTGTVDLSTFQSSGRNCADAARFRVISLTNNAAEVDTNPASNNCIRSGDEVMLINLQGTSGSTVNGGNYEFLRVQSVTSPPHIITFSTNKTKFYGENSGDDSNIGINPTPGSQQRVILQRVPNYSRVSVHPGGKLTAALWDATVVEYECESNSVTGTRGGVLAFKTFDTVGILGEITMNTKGFLGGRTGGASFSGSGSNNHSLKGESIAGMDPFVAVGSATCGGANTSGQVQPANIGGGGSAQGTISTPNPASTVTAGSGGGGNYGGIATNGTNGNINSTILYGGIGANTYGYSTLSKLLMGSGGGGGGSLNAQTSLGLGGNGGRGGGIIHIGARNIVGSGVISSNGESGFPGVRGTYLGNSYDSGSGGGGSGGSVNIDSDEFGFDNTQLQVNGGIGGVWNSKFGGNGGKGRARVDSTSSLFRNLISYWKMDEASGNSVRDSNARLNGVAVSNPLVETGSNAKIGNARRFNGSNQYVYTHDSPLLTLSQVTLNAWIRTTVTDGTILSQYNGGVQGGILFYVQNGKLLYHDGGGFWVTSNGSINDGNWHMVTYAQSNNSDHKLYIDGALDITSTNVAGIQNSTELLQIGARLTSGSPASFFNGTIDEVGIWSRALSASEIGSLYASGNGKTYPLDPSSTVYLAASPAALSTGNFTVSWKNIQSPSSPSSTDWIGLYPTAAPDSPRPAGWLRVGCTQTSTNAVTSGSCAYSPSSVSGSYHFRLFSNDTTSNPIATSNGVSISANDNDLDGVSSLTDCDDTNTNGSQYVYQNKTVIADTDQDGYGTGASGTQCVGGSTTVSGRTYYKSRVNAFTWLDSAGSLGTDCNDTSVNIYTTAGGINFVTDADHDSYYNGTPASQCVGATQVFNTRTYYKDIAGTYTWLPYTVASTFDCNDNDPLGNFSATGYRDNDGDSYGAGSAQTVCHNGVFPIAGWSTSSTDCNDANLNVFQNVYVDRDADRDRSGDLNYANQNLCVGAANGSLVPGYRYYSTDGGGTYPYINHADTINSGDCYDWNGNAWPGQTGFFPDDPGFNNDYNCDGTVEINDYGPYGYSYTCNWGDYNICTPSGETCDSNYPFFKVPDSSIPCPNGYVLKPLCTGSGCRIGANAVICGGWVWRDNTSGFPSDAYVCYRRTYR